MVALYRENILNVCEFCKKNILNYINTNCTFSKKKIRHTVHLLFGKNFHVNKFVTCNCNCSEKCILIHRMLQVRCFLKVCIR